MSKQKYVNKYFYGNLFENPILDDMNLLQDDTST